VRARGHGICRWVIAAALAAAASCYGADAPELPVPRAAVFDFTEPAEWPGRLIGRRAADAVFAALRESVRWRTVDRAAVLLACADEGLVPPFAVGHLQMLGERLGAPLAVAGLVQVCEVNAERRSAQVTLIAELVETLGGSSLASVRGVASARAEDEPLALAQVVDRALAEAAGDLVRALTNFEPAGGQVVTTLPDGRVVLDVPAEPEVRPGDTLLVLRGGEAAGALKVESVNLTVVHARPLAGEEFRGGERAVLVAR